MWSFDQSAIGYGACLGRSTLRIEPFQQKRDADADENGRPDPTGVDVDYARSREQEHGASNQE